MSEGVIRRGGEEGELRRAGGAGAAVCGGGVAVGGGGLEVEEDFAGALDDRPGQAGEFGDVDAVAAVGAAGDDAAEEDDAAVLLGDGDVAVADAGRRWASSTSSW